MLPVSHPARDRCAARVPGSVLGLRNNPDAEANIARLVAAWRRDGRTIRHVHHSSRSSTGHFFLERRGIGQSRKQCPPRMNRST